MIAMEIPSGKERSALFFLPPIRDLAGMIAPGF
jgi:hypothetical protein